MRKRGLLTMVSLFLLSLFLAGCGGGGGGGGTGGGQTTPSNIAVSPVVARNSSGQAVVAYLRQYPGSRVYVNYYDGNWLSPLQISGETASHPKVAISDNGNAIVVWAENGYILAKIYKNGWSQNYTIAGPIDAEDFSVAMYPDGKAIVVWSTGKKIVKREFNNNAWDDPITIYDCSSSQWDSVSHPLVAIDKNAQPQPIADFVWLHAHQAQAPNDSTYQRILLSPGGAESIVVWKKDSNLPLVGYYLTPTSFMVTCDVIIFIHYMKVEYPQSPSDPFTITTQVYASINPNGINEPTPISNPRTATVSSYPNNALDQFVGQPLGVMDDECNAIAVWQEKEGPGDWQDHVWYNIYKNNWQQPQRITTIDTSSDYLASYDPIVDFLINGKALLVYARNSQSGSPGYFATIADFTQSPVSFSTPSRISRDPTLILTEPGVSKGLAVWVDSKTTTSQMPDTVYGRFYNYLEDQWSDIFQIGD